MSHEDAQEACLDMYGAVFNLTGGEEQLGSLKDFFVNGKFFGRANIGWEFLK